MLRLLCLFLLKNKVNPKDWRRVFRSSDFVGMSLRRDDAVIYV